MALNFQDPTAWIDDPNVHVDDKELLEHAATLEAQLLRNRSRVGLAVFTILVSALAGAFAGFTVSPVVRSSWIIFVGYLAGGVVVLRGLGPLSRRLVGASAGWRVMFAFFWSCALAVVAVLGARIDTAWLFYVVVLGGGLFIGLMYFSTDAGPVRDQDAWLIAALPLGAMATWSASRLQHALDVSSDPAWSEAYVGSMAASVFMVPMAVLVALVSTRSNGLAKMATLYLHNENFIPKAIEYLDQAIALSPRSADLYNRRGIAHSKLGHGDLADADFKKVSELSPRAAEAHMNRGVDLLKHGQFDRSIDTLTRATTINPKLATAHSNLGTAYQKKGDLDAAIESYSRAIALRAKYPVAFANRSFSYYLKGEHDRAIADATRAITLAPQFPMAHVNLGHALAAKGNHALAARSFRAALELKPDQAVTEEALAALAKLGAGAHDEDHHDDQ